MGYQVTWLTDQLGVGHAPMSYTELDRIREQGVDAIVNLCGEFCDLHTLEEQSGFEVYYLPIPDECAPDLESMEKGLEWLDEAFYLGKKVLIHCRHGMGRTGTFVSAYMLRRGLAKKSAERRLKGTKAHPTNFQQWKLLRTYAKKIKTLTLQTPTLKNRPTPDLEPFHRDYLTLLEAVDSRLPPDPASSPCGTEHHPCCYGYFELHLIESITLSRIVNKLLSSQQRKQVIQRALTNTTRLRQLQQETPGMSLADQQQHYLRLQLKCPLLGNDHCLVFEHRPFRCRTIAMNREDQRQFDEDLITLSKNVYFHLVGEFPPARELVFSILDTLSGKFVQTYFQLINGHGL